MTRTTSGGGRRLTAACLVVSRPVGVGIARLDAAAPWDTHAPGRIEVDAADLGALVAARRDGDLDAALAGHLPPERAASLLAGLDALGLVVDGASTPSTEPPPDVPATGALDGDGPWELVVPLALGITAHGLEVRDRDGALLAVLRPAELWAARALAGRTLDDAVAQHAADLGPAALGAPAVAEVAARLRAVGLLVPPRPDAPVRVTDEDRMRRAFRADVALRGLAAEEGAERDRCERERVGPDGAPRIPVLLPQITGNIPPLSLGMVLAHAQVHDGGRLAEHYDLSPRWIFRAEDAPGEAGDPVVVLFSDYLWSHEQNLEISAGIKARNPAAVLIHGGPDCPSYPGDDEAYLRRHPHIDVAVRGEGEVTASEVLAALAEPLRAGSSDRSALAGVAGIAYRDGDRIVRTADRARIEDLDAIPSPYLAGVYDLFARAGEIGMAVIETNRGCPYGCTFCDWGSATNSRIRKFDLERVFAELEWCARNGVPRIFMADANFGIFSRDVDIARHVVDLHARYGSPERLITNYAKNTVKHLTEIVTTLASGGVLTEGLLSLQSMDDATLTAIRRSNIKLEKYEALARQFRHSSLPLFVDLMMGLPGQTRDAFQADLQQCVDREVNAKCHQTELLVNSPMNDPAYRAEHRIELTRDPGAIGVGAAQARRIGPALVVSSASFGRDDYIAMHRMRRTYLLAENFGVLRHVARVVRQEVGLPEVALYECLRRLCETDPEQRPHLALGLLAVPDVMVPPVSWGLFVDELGDALVAEVGMAPGTVLDTALAVQRALLPSPGRAFPTTVALAHDFVAWHDAVLAAKDEGHLGDWPAVAPRLGAFGPGELIVDDPRDVCGRSLGGDARAVDPYGDWELRSPLARAMPGHYQIS